MQAYMHSRAKDVCCVKSPKLTLTGVLLLQMFTFPDWKRHRSSFRYVHHLQTIFESRIVRGLLRPVLVITACCVGESSSNRPTPPSFAQHTQPGGSINASHTSMIFKHLYSQLVCSTRVNAQHAELFAAAKCASAAAGIAWAAKVLTM
jgi:hypothetical protein